MQIFCSVYDIRLLQANGFVFFHAHYKAIHSIKYFLLEISLQHAVRVPPILTSVSVSVPILVQ